MEGEQGFLSPARPSRVSSEGGDGRGFGSPTWSSPLGPLLDSPSSCISVVGGCGNGGSGSGFSSPTWGSPLETLFNSPSSCVSDSRGGGNGSGSGSGFRTLKLKQTSPLEKLLDSPSSCISDSHGDGNGSGFSMPKQASPLETLLDSRSPSSCVSDSRGRGNSSSPRVSKEQDSEVREAEKILGAIIERYNDCFLRLRIATAEVADLRRERIRLGAENLHLSLLLEELEAAEQSKASAAALAPARKPVEAQAASGCAPRSIAIRSKDFLSQKQPQREAQPQRLRVRASPVMEDAGEKEKDDGEVEMEAYRQGAVKTELCNKWERGACPYEERCRFAHGMGELRPVIRHPRYKTLACQLFAAASGCPYGHRCHFRHSLPPTAQFC